MEQFITLHEAYVLTFQTVLPILSGTVQFLGIYMQNIYLHITIQLSY